MNDLVIAFTVQFWQYNTDRACIFWVWTHAKATYCAGATTLSVKVQLASQEIAVTNFLRHGMDAPAVLYWAESRQQWRPFSRGHLADPRDVIARRLCVFAGEKNQLNFSPGLILQSWALNNCQVQICWVFALRVCHSILFRFSSKGTNALFFCLTNILRGHKALYTRVI